MRARLKVSKAGIELIKSFEGLRQTAARLPDGRWTLGYGHTFSAREGARVTQEDADALLRFDLLPIVDAVNNLVLVPLNQNQFDALVSFCFNIGVDNFGQSTVLKRVNEGRMTEAALAMDSWRSAEFNGQTYVLAPLIRRRAAEKNLFLTPEETAGNAPSLLVRPVEDMHGETTSTPTEVQSPDRGGILSAYPVGQPEAAPQPAPVPQPVPAPQPAPQPVLQSHPQAFGSQIPLPYASPYANPIPVTPQREVIDLNAYTPVPVEAAPVASSEEPVMSPETQAALARAQEEQRLREEAQRQAESLAAARAAEEARIQEEQRQASLRAEQERVERERLERERLEREHQERLQAERERIEQMRQEQLRLDQERQERERVEREAHERAERDRLEHERLERERLEREQAEAARIEQERLARERDEQASIERERAEQERIERERREAEEQAQAAAAAVAAPVSDDEAEKQRKAEAAAALMRLYSPYAGGLGRPLGGGLAPRPAPITPPPAPSEPVVVPEAKPHAEPEPVQEFTNHSVIAPSVTESEPIEDVREEALPSPVVVPFAPVQSPSNMPPPVITALNPYARPLTRDEVVEVPRPAPVDMAKVEVTPEPVAAPQPEPVATASATPHWREQLQRPLPKDYRPPETTEAEHQPSLLQSAQAARYDMYDEDNAEWSMDGRIAVTSDEVHIEHRSWLSMLTSTLKWVFISLIGMGSLGVAAASYWKSRDPTVIRNGFFHDYMTLSVITAAVGILCVSISVWLIMRRLGGLKD